jgi:stress-induced-phosphoprotein 1
MPLPSARHRLRARNAVYFSNRSAAYANCSKFDEALDDARLVLKLKPGWVKGHARAAAAYMGLELYSEAKEAYEKAVKLEPDDQVIWPGGPAVSEHMLLRGCCRSTHRQDFLGPAMFFASHVAWSCCTHAGELHLLCALLYTWCLGVVFPASPSARRCTTCA